MENSWEKVQVKDLGRIVTGKTPSTAISKYFGNDYMFITPTELHDGFIITKSGRGLSKIGLQNIKSNSIRGLSVLVGCIGWDMGNVAIVDQECATNQQINTITEIKEKYNPYYIYYWLLLQKEYLFKIAAVTRTPILAKSTFEEIIIPIPSKNIQDNISNFLLNIDRKIVINYSINTELEKLAKTIYNYWFDQFDFPDKNGKPYKSSGGTMVYNEILKREIPNGWAVEKLNKYAEIGSGYVFKPEDYIINGKFGVVTIKNVQDGFLDLSSLKKVDFIPNNIKPFCKLAIGDALMSLTGNIGRMCFVDKEDLLLNQRVGKLLVNDTKYFEYIYMFLTGNEQRARLNNISGGSSQSNLSPIEAVNTDFVIPNVSILLHFNKIITQLFDLYLKNRRQNYELTALRDFLLPLLMNGQVTVGSASKEKPVIVPFSTEDTAYQTFRKEIGLAARGDIDELTIQNMYKAHCEKVEEIGQSKNRNRH